MINKSLYGLLFLAVLLQSLIPIGFMPAYAHDGFVIEICSGNDLIEIQYNKDSDNHDKAQSDCPYCFLNNYHINNNVDVILNAHVGVAYGFSDRSASPYFDLTSINIPRAPPLFTV
jgi:hypothetical protein